MLSLYIWVTTHKYSSSNRPIKREQRETDAKWEWGASSVGQIMAGEREGRGEGNSLELHVTPTPRVVISNSQPWLLNRWQRRATTQCVVWIDSLSLYRQQASALTSAVAWRDSDVVWSYLIQPFNYQTAFWAVLWKRKKTATKAQIYFQRKRKCKVNKTATRYSRSATASVSVTLNVSNDANSRKDLLFCFFSLYRSPFRGSNSP